MKERPLLFSAPMVRALLDGRKTQTRRIVTTREPLQFLGGRGEEADPDRWGWFFDGPDHHGYMVLGRGHDERHDNGITSIPCPYGKPGDRLWVRETWRSSLSDERTIHYAASLSEYDRKEKGPWRPSIFMPRWASRITLEIAEVRVQRLQSISEDDARAEGVEPYTPPHGHISPEQRVPGPGFDRARLGDQPHRLPFADLWDSINGKRRRKVWDDSAEEWRTVIDTSDRWDANPWIWALTFRRLP